MEAREDRQLRHPPGRLPHQDRMTISNVAPEACPFGQSPILLPTTTSCSNVSGGGRLWFDLLVFGVVGQAEAFEEQGVGGDQEARAGHGQGGPFGS